MGVCTFVFEGVGHIDNLQMREDAGGTQWDCAGFVYTRVCHARNHSLLLDLRFVNSANDSPNRRSVLKRIEGIKRFRLFSCKS